MFSKIIYKCLKASRFGKEIACNVWAKIKRENKRYYFRTIQRAPTGDPKNWYIQIYGLAENKRIVFPKDKYPVMPDVFLTHSIEGAFVDFVTQDKKFISVKIGSVDFLQAVKESNEGIYTKRIPAKITHSDKSKYYPIQREILSKERE